MGGKEFWTRKGEDNEVRNWSGRGWGGGNNAAYCAFLKVLWNGSNDQQITE